MVQRTQMKERDERTLHEKRVEAGRLGGLAPHECRGRQCSSKERTASTTSAKLSEAKAEGGRRSRRGRS